MYMENKTVISCPNCNQKVRIPIGKHIKFTCPNCSNEFEMDSRVKQASKKSNTTLYLSIFFGVLFYSGYKYYTKHSSTKAAIEITSNTEICDKNLNELIKAVDVSNEVTNDYAVRLASQFPDEYNVAQVCQIYDYIVSNWKYVNDSDKMENLRSASRTINNGLAGDCDDFAILLAALIESIGGDARISFAYNNEGGHAFTEILATEKEEDMQGITDKINALYRTDQFKIHYWVDDDGKCWLNLDWFGEPQHPGGEYFEFDYRTIYYPTLETPTYIQER